MNLELTFNPVRPNDLTVEDRTTYVAGLRDVIASDAVVIAASGNINVSPCFLPASMLSN